MRIQDVMTRRPTTVTPDDFLNRAAQLMWDHDCGCLPVVNRDGDLRGIITDRDILMAAYTRGIGLRELTVESAMSHPVHTCGPRQKVADVERIMNDYRIRRVPVVDDFGALVGIVSLSDLARHVDAGHVRGLAEAPGVLHTLASISTRRVARA